MTEDSSSQHKASRRRSSRQHSRTGGSTAAAAKKKSRFALREVSLPWCGGCLGKPIVVNPAVTSWAALCLLGLVFWASVDSKGALDWLLLARGVIARRFAWFFQGTKVIFFIFLLYVGIRYGDIKFSTNPQDTPEYSDLNFFTMTFSTGVGVGFFVYGVAEPLWHQTSHFYERAGYRSQDEIDMFALNMAVTNWGISGWSTYLMVTLAVGLATHRFGLPLLFRSAFYPMLGEYTWGWLGDGIDTMAILVTFCGLCTSLGLATFQLLAAFRFMGWFSFDSISDGVAVDADTKFVQISIVWVITLMSTISVVSGINGGIRVLSYIAVGLGFFLLILMLALDDTTFLLNLTAQEVGVYLQRSVLELNFWTDAFGQLRSGNGRSVDGKSAEMWWMDAWMVFYQAWWVSWAAFCGMLTAKISKGRTIRDVIAYSAVAPIAVCLVWFCVWGGAGLRQHRQALELEKLGLDAYDNSRHFSVELSDFCFHVPQSDIVVNGTTYFEAANIVRGVTPVCKFDSAHDNLAAYYVMYSYTYGHERGFGPFLGSRNDHWVRRASWSVLEGIVATTLIVTGGGDALRAVQASAIIAGLPFCGLLLILVPAISDFCIVARRRDMMTASMPTMNIESIHDAGATVAAETATKKSKRPELFKHVTAENEFDMPLYGGVLNVLEFVASCGKVHPERIERGMHLPTEFQVRETLLAIVAPFIGLQQILNATNMVEQGLFRLLIVGSFSFAYAAWIATGAAWLFGYAGLLPWSLATYFFCGVMLTGIRTSFRFKYRMRSSLVSDILGSTFLWPQVICQMHQQCCFNLPSDKKLEELRQKHIYTPIARAPPAGPYVPQLNDHLNDTNYKDWNLQGLNMTVYA